MHFSWKQDSKTLLMVVIASVTMAVNINTFVLTGGLYPGGVTGLTLLIQRFCEAFFGFHLPYALVNVLLNLFLLKKYTYVGAAFTTLIAEILVVGLGIAFARQYMPFAAIVKKFFVALLGGAVIVAVCAAASAAELPLIPGMIVKIGVSCICYGGIIFLFPDTRKLLKSFWT